MKLNRFLTTILMLFCLFNLQAQSTFLDQYEVRFSSTFRIDFLEDNDLLIASSFKENPTSNFFNGLQVILHNECEGIQEVKEYRVENHYMELADMLKDSEGYIYLTGYFFSSSDNRNIFLLKLNPDRTENFFQIYSRPFNEYIYSLQETPTGDLVLFGTTYMNGINNPRNFILKLDKLGDIVSSKVYIESGTWGRTIACSDGGVLARMANVIYKIDAAGNFVWGNQYQGLSYSSIPVEVEDGYVAVSYRAGPTIDPSFLYKINLDGEIEWVSPGFESYGRPKLKNLSNGNFLVQDAAPDEFNSEKYHLSLLEFDATGNPISNTMITPSYGDISVNAIAHQCVLLPDESLAFSTSSGDFRDTLLIGKTNTSFELGCNDVDNFNQDTIINLVVVPRTIPVADVIFETEIHELEVSEIDLVGERFCENLVYDFPAPQNDTILCQGESLSLDFTMPGANYLWQDGSTEATIDVTNSGVYTVLIEKCNQTVERKVEVIFNECSCLLEIPNAFTPDADGRNDNFNILINCPITDYQMEIYSRWGDLVFSSSDSSIAWDGRVGGSPLPSDVYIYKYQYRLKGTSTKLEQGHGDVMLIR